MSREKAGTIFGPRSVFLAGSISPGDWRKSICREESLTLSCEDVLSLNEKNSWVWPTRKNAILSTRLNYAGPFLIGEDIQNAYMNEYDGDYSMQAIEKSDFVFAHIEKPDPLLAFHIGYAAGLKKPIYINFLSYPTETPGLTANSLIDCSTSITVETDVLSEFFHIIMRDGWVCESPIEVVFMKEAYGILPDLRSQHQINQYRIDFAIPSHRLAIELDGHDSHKTKEQRTHDASRDRFLIQSGWTVLRFTGSEVFKDTKGCVSQVLQIIKTSETSIEQTPTSFNLLS